jgi:hypothetical protein
MGTENETASNILDNAVTGYELSWHDIVAPLTGDWR